MEIMLKGQTTISESVKEFNMAAIDFKDDSPSVVTLSKLDSLNVWDRVSIDVKVLTVMDPVSVSGGKKKQDVVAADSTGVGKVTVWEESIGTLTEQCSYSLKNFIVREFASKKFLSMGKEGSQIVSIEDIGDVVEDNELLDEPDEEIRDAQIVGVAELNTYKACLRCKARVEPSSPLGRCSKSECAMLQRYDMCQDQLSARLMFLSKSKMVSLSAYGQVVRDLAGVTDDAVTEEMLVMVPKLSSVKYNGQNVITGFEPFVSVP